MSFTLGLKTLELNFNMLWFSHAFSTDMAALLRWCALLETHRRAETPEALRLACAQALALTGAAVVTRSLMGNAALKALSTRWAYLYICKPKKV